MSLIHQNQISQLRGLTESEAFVLYRLADRADKNGQNCYPGEELLAYECRIDKRTVRYVLASLEQLGVIAPVEDFRRTAPGRRKRYNLTFDHALRYGIIREVKEARPRKPRKTVLTSPKEESTDSQADSSSTAGESSYRQYSPDPPLVEEQPDYQALENERARLLRWIEMAQEADIHPTTQNLMIRNRLNNNRAYYENRLVELDAILGASIETIS